MKIAINSKPQGFHIRWRQYCEEKGIPYKLVDCSRSDIIEQLADCDALMWNHHQGAPEDLLFAKQLLFAVQHSGKVVFPDFNTGWHFDDKIGQKYLFESAGAPFVETYVSYNKTEALRWLDMAQFPLVFKLRSGAGAQNVELVKTKKRAKNLTRKAFGKGFPKFNRVVYMQDRIKKVRAGLDKPIGALKGIGRLFIPTKLEKQAAREKGYVYFQEFLPDNDHDIRVVVIAEKAYAIKRLVRENDFRASGSGYIIFEKEKIDTECVDIAFKVARELRLQCASFDFAYKKGRPVIIEISYASPVRMNDPWPGYWDKALNWHEEKFNPYGWMVDAVIEKIRNG